MLDEVYHSVSPLRETADKDAIEVDYKDDEMVRK